MEITLNLDNCSTYISSGRVSNIFKSLGLKEIAYEENKLLQLHKNKQSEEFSNHENLFKLAESKMQELSRSKSSENQHYFNQLANNNVSHLNYANTINKDMFNDIIEQTSEKVLNKKEIQEKILKLKKLKAMNS